MVKENSGILRPHLTLVSIITRFSDLIIIGACLAVSLYLVDLTWTLKHSVLLLGSWFIFHVIADILNIYSSWRGSSLYAEIKSITSCWTISISTLLLISFFLVEAEYIYLNNWLWIPLWYMAACTCFSIYRIIARKFLSLVRIKGFNTRTAVIVGYGKVGQDLESHIISAPWMGIKFLGFFDDKIKSHVGQIGNTNNLYDYVKSNRIDRVYITLPLRAEDKMKNLISQLADTTATVYFIPDVFTFELLNARQQSINGITTISIFDSPMDGLNSILKRIEDFSLALFISIFAFFPMLFIALAVKLTSKGPVLFKQTRYGFDGQPIKVYKFRSMNVMDNCQNNIRQATKNDSRLTPIGAFLRSTSLDELPQLYNVLQGRMSLVGPRPHAVAHNEEYRKLIPGYMLRHKVKPGITGWAQVNGLRGETETLDKMENRVKYDLDYIRNWSLMLDCKIVFLTIFKLKSSNAY